MSMVFCRTCGGNVAGAETFCPGCGASQSSEVMRVHQEESKQVLSSAWQRRFTLIDKAGGPKLPKLRNLPFREIWAIRFNALAFLFGPIYYIAKGMWKKGLVLVGLIVVLVGLASAFIEALGFSSNILLFVGPAVMSGYSNVTYYRLVKERRNAWW